MYKKRNSIRLLIITSFALLIILTFSITGYFALSSWQTSAEQVVAEIQDNTNQIILNEIEAYINEPLHSNEAARDLIEKDIVDISDSSEREIYFASVIKASGDKVYSYSYGSQSGEYYGARRNSRNEIEIIENNAVTGGKSRYYLATPQLTKGALVEETEKFDARTRDWYKAAQAAKGPAFSPIYRHFVMDDLAISAAYPIYDRQGGLKGVLGTHITLSTINNYLKQLVKDRRLTAYIIEKDSGYLVANSLDRPNFVTLKDNEIKRISIEEIDNKAIMTAYQRYKQSGAPSYILPTENDQLYVKLSEYQKAGLHWIIITAIPGGTYTAGITKSIQFSLLASVLAVVMAIFIYTKCTAVVLRPIYNLIETTEKFSQGDFSQRAQVYRNDETGKLAIAFNKMAEQIDSLIHTLENRIKERTRELEATIVKLKSSQNRIEYLSYRDPLTNLYNRRFFEEELIRLDSEKALPLTIIMADMNGLKLINDSLGHAVGDQLLRKAAEVLTRACPPYALIARVGGDEFVILLPNTEAHRAKECVKHIKIMAAGEQVGSVTVSLSLGYSTKNTQAEDIKDNLKLAEDQMYRNKLFESPSMRGKTINTIIHTLHEKNKREEAHSQRVSELCRQVGEVLGLPQSDIEELKTVGLLHDIGKIAIEESILNKPEKLTDSEWEEIKRHPEVGYRILSTVNNMSEMAEHVLAHHERWDGKGYPKGLQGAEIPFQARIIHIADAYDAMTSDRSYRAALSEEEAVAELLKQAGSQFDPELVWIFVYKVLGKS